MFCGFTQTGTGKYICECNRSACVHWVGGVQNKNKWPNEGFWLERFAWCNIRVFNLCLCVCLCVCLQRGGTIWAEENDGGKVRGEPSRDFAKVGSFHLSKASRRSRGRAKLPSFFCLLRSELYLVQNSVTARWLCPLFNFQLYELDNDPKRKEFLDQLFVFMQKRGELQSDHFQNDCRNHNGSLDRIDPHHRDLILICQNAPCVRL